MLIWVILPAFNEEEALKKLLPKIDSHFAGMQQAYRVVVINDGSYDGTAGILEELSGKYPIDVINHRINRGLGETERDGFEYVARQSADDDIIIRTDCDDTHEPEYFSPLIDCIKEGYDVVSASRFQPGGGQMGVNAYRAIVSKCANIFMRLLFNISGIKDYSCGFRAYRSRVIKYAVKIFGNGFVQLKGMGFTSTLEMVVKLNLLGCKFKEIPFVLRYDHKTGPSKMITSVTTLGYLVMAFLYHWPLGGWRSHYHGLRKAFCEEPEHAVKLFGYRFLKRPMISKIGG